MNTASKLIAIITAITLSACSFGLGRGTGTRPLSKPAPAQVEGHNPNLARDLHRAEQRGLGQSD
jgi:hypothetical protein